MSEPMALAQCLRALQDTTEARRATVYLGEKLVVSTCRRFRFSKRNTRNDFVVKIGVPNYEERNFLRACKKAGEPLPVRRVQLKYWPVKKKAA